MRTFRTTRASCGSRIATSKSGPTAASSPIGDETRVRAREGRPDRQLRRLLQPLRQLRHVLPRVRRPVLEEAELLRQPRRRSKPARRTTVSCWSDRRLRLALRWPNRRPTLSLGAVRRTATAIDTTTAWSPCASSRTERSRRRIRAHRRRTPRMSSTSAAFTPSPRCSAASPIATRVHAVNTPLLAHNAIGVTLNDTSTRQRALLNRRQSPETPTSRFSASASVRAACAD